MKEYLHNGEKVILQTVIDRCFLDALNEKGIIPEELPIDNFEIRVFKYSIDGVKRYACVKAYGREDYFEDIYITYSVPEDGFERMMYDVEAQARGECTFSFSRLKWAYLKACKDAEDYVCEKYNINPEDIPTGSMEDIEARKENHEYYDKIENEMKFLKKISLNKYGYNYDMIDKIAAADVNKEHIKDILK